MKITSTSNQKIKVLLQLKRSKKYRGESGLYLVEGRRMFREAPPADVREIYVTDKFLAAHLEEVGGLCRKSGVEYVLLTETVMEHVSDTRTPQGILLVMQQKQYRERDLYKDEQALVMVLEDLQDPGNVGTILRAGEAAGVTGILLSAGCADIYNPKTIRATMGSVYRVPFCYTDDLPASLRRMKERGITVYAAALQDDSKAYNEQTFSRRSAVLIGNEGSGLSAEMIRTADVPVHIPMKGQVESLNAAIAATILMFEANKAE